jgi:hypothetical protein
MPIALDPQETFEIILESDKDKPQESQPRFIYRYLTCRQWRKLSGYRDELEKLKQDKSATIDNVMNKTIEMASMNLVSWENIFGNDGELITFDKDKFEDIVTIIEANELIVKLSNQGLTFDDKKKLDSQKDFDMAESAKDAKA